MLLAADVIASLAVWMFAEARTTSSFFTNRVLRQTFWTASSFSQPVVEIRAPRAGPAFRFIRWAEGGCYVSAGSTASVVDATRRKVVFGVQGYA